MIVSMIYFTLGFFLLTLFLPFPLCMHSLFYRRNDAHLTLLKRRFDFDHISMINRMTA